MSFKVQPFYSKHKLALALLVAILLGGIVVWLGIILDRRSTTESISIQIIQLFLTTCAAVLPTRVLAQRQENEINKNRAKMALKRTVTLYNQMNQVAQHIEDQRGFLRSETNDNMIKYSLVENSLDTISNMHKLQYGVIQDINSDWSDVIPEEYDKLRREQSEKGENQRWA